MSFFLKRICRHLFQWLNLVCLPACRDKGLRLWALICLSVNLILECGRRYSGSFFVLLLKEILSDQLEDICNKSHTWLLDIKRCPSKHYNVVLRNFVFSNQPGNFFSEILSKLHSLLLNLCTPVPPSKELVWPFHWSFGVLSSEQPRMFFLLIKSPMWNSAGGVLLTSEHRECRKSEVLFWISAFVCGCGTETWNKPAIET